LEAHKVQHRIQ
jgi:hypothetical protein